MSKYLAFLMVTLHATGIAWAEPLSFRSSNARTTLVELYTSEGCSSCPRADRWLSTLKADKRLWKSVVPVAFHVDYWNYLGWTDRFSTAIFSLRQRNYVRAGLASTVYTPGFFVNGEEWRGWFSDPTLDAGARPSVGKLSLQVDGTDVEAIFEPAFEVPGPLHLHLVVTGSELRTEVQAGENRGRALDHNFVVLGYGLNELDANGNKFYVNTTLPPLSADSRKRAVTAWVTADTDPRPLQSVGGWLQKM